MVPAGENHKVPVQAGEWEAASGRQGGHTHPVHATRTCSSLMVLLASGRAGPAGLQSLRNSLPGRVSSISMAASCAVSQCPTNRWVCALAGQPAPWRARQAVTTAFSAGSAEPNARGARLVPECKALRRGPPLL